ncbi:MAG TPA: hypothetical protein VJP40_01070 [bacterium]|nr:hypothetical protein [bacterium]
MISRGPSNSPYIVSPIYDWVFFLLPPLFCLALGMLLSLSHLSETPLIVAGASTTVVSLLLGVVVHAHLGAVLFRSHGNPEVFRLHPLRFLLVPVLIWIAIVSSAWIAVAATVVATFWDVWHSGAQTFGFGRFYDRNLGLDAHKTRRLDFWLNQLLYAGPILAGVTLKDHLGELENFSEVGTAFFAAIPAYVESRQRYLTWGILIFGTLFLLYYVYAHWRLWRRGHRISFHKMYLLVSTGFCSIYSWAFNTWGEAFFIMNLFHAVQYLALMWATEGGRISTLLRASPGRSGSYLALGAFLGLTLSYGFFAEVLSEKLDMLWAFTIVVSLMHFWYDGFIWSVRKAQVTS